MPGHGGDGHSESHLYLLFLHVRDLPVHGSHGKAKSGYGGSGNLVRQYPDRFAFAGLVPLPDVEGALEETAYALDELGAAGLKVATNMGGIYLGDPEPVQLSILRMVAEDDHIVFGIDFPYSPAKMILAKKKHFDDNKEYDIFRECSHASEKRKRKWLYNDLR